MIERRLLSIVFLSGALSACAVAPPDFEAHTGDDVTLRHPVELRQGWQEITLPLSARLDARERDRIADFAADWRRFGGGDIYVRITAQGWDEKVLRIHVARLREVMAESGVDAHLTLLRAGKSESGRTPLMIASFKRMKAEVVTTCGQWPDNLATGPGIGWQNRSYSNFGCAQQSMIAAQTADPRDLFTARASSPVDAQMRVRTLEILRNGSQAARNGD